MAGSLAGNTSLRKVNIGCGHDKRPTYLNVDIDPNCEPDVLITSLDDLVKLGTARFDEVLAKDVLEHIPRAQTVSALLEMSALLPVGGILEVETSSLFDLMARMNERADFAHQHNWSTCLFGNQVKPGDWHFTGFTRATLAGHLLAAGFEIEREWLVDGWCFHVIAKKTWDWLSLAELPPGAMVDETYRAAFKREPDDVANKYWKVRAERESKRAILRELLSAPEALFTAGFAIDSRAASSRSA